MSNLDSKRLSQLAQLTRLQNTVENLQSEDLVKELLQTHLKNLEAIEEKHQIIVNALEDEDGADFAKITNDAERFQEKSYAVKKQLLTLLNVLPTASPATSPSKDLPNFLINLNEDDQRSVCSEGNVTEGPTNATKIVCERELKFIESEISSYRKLSEGENNSIFMLKSLLSSIEPLLERHSELSTMITKSGIDDDELERLYKRREEFKQIFFSVTCSIQCRIHEIEPMQALKMKNEVYSPRIKLPTIDLPKFDGTPDQWISYRDTFKTLVHNNAGLAPSSKFRYLKSTIIDKRSPICHLIESDDGYDNAWNIVIQHYDDKRKIMDSPPSKTGTVLLSTASVLLQDSMGEWHEARALLDSGSDANFITQRIADVLQLKKTPTLVEAHGFGEKSEMITKLAKASLRSRDGSYCNELEFLVTRKITGQTPSTLVTIESGDYPQTLALADPLFNVPGPIDLLIGNEVFFELLRNNKIKLSLGPMMQETVFGWIFAGRVENQFRRIRTQHCNLVTKHELNESIERFWKEDDYRNQKRFLTEEEEYCEQVFEQTHRRSSDGRFVIKIPLKENVDQLVNNRNQALCQFIANEKRLAKNERLKSETVKFMREYEELGHMEEIHSVPEEKISYYLPHHAVEKPDSTTTKVRIVFNASAKTKSGLSFNDVQCVGPTIQSSTFSLMLKFRQHPIVIKADIAKMYRQIEVSPDQRNFQLILWRENPCDKMKTYQLKTVTYGTSSASYQSTRCLKQLSIEHKKKFPKASEEIDKGFFVDDLVSGAETIEEAIKLYKEIDFIISSGAMKLRKFISNNDEFMSNVPIEDQEKSEGADKTFAILGVQWNAGSDEIAFDVKPIDFKVITKRAILSEITKIYDPEGLLGPVIFKLKLFMKKIHLLNVNWDEKLKDEVANEWQEIGRTFSELRQIKIKRLISLNTYITLQLHAFSDASEKGFGAVIYVRTEDSNGTRLSKLFCAKSRVAPNARKSIVRLELCGGVIGANILSQVSEAMISKVHKKFLWLDSAIVLHWLKKSPSQLQTYVAGRVSEIQSLTKDVTLRHVRGEENPSDLISRGLMPMEIIDNKMWWEGPDFLRQSEDTWPESIVNIDPEDPEYKVEFKKITSLVQQKTLGENPFIKWVEDSSRTFSSKMKLAMVLRFLHNTQSRKLHQPKRTGNVNVEELREAELTLVRMHQKEHLNEEFKALSNGKVIATNSKIMNLCPFWDKNDRIIRVGGRLRNASHIDEDQKHQIVLPKCHFSKLIIRETHQKNMHAGQQATLGALRMKFYILGAKNCVRMEIHRCIKCFRSRPKMIEQLMGQLPSPRVTPAHPFYNVGVDYAGPILMKTSKIRNAKQVKCYIALFICLATKAIHIEIVTDLTTEAFLASMNRFVSRRGLCKNIYSDHGTNFVGAKNKLLELQKFLNDSSTQATLNKKCLEQEISWHFIPPRAPEHGGLWEAGVKSMKYHLERVIGSATLTYEELSTLLCKIEAILNSRPLIPVSDDPNDAEALTAGHFLVGRPLISMPQANCADETMSRLNRWDSILHIQQQFWKRWSRDYLHLLQARTKNYKHRVPVKVGQIVLMQIEDCLPMQWPLGKIVAIYPGTDELTRVASIKTSKGVYERRVNKLAILPIEENEQIVAARVC